MIFLCSVERGENVAVKRASILQWQCSGLEADQTMSSQQLPKN